MHVSPCCAGREAVSAQLHLPWVALRAAGAESRSAPPALQEEEKAGLSFGGVR